ncbi:isoaspartyl peptidase/L-asparaginase-like [Amphiura filiformis]|uniref:isoaspartyl peptidase/L-asparaginase-like n=1 Tax=Amphiura filiformis TaxID=82378 RepID=UPI003B225EB9
MNCSTITPTIVIHGGAWAIPESLLEASCVGVQNAARAGYQILVGEGGSALDAVQAAVRVLEDDPALDAGTGSVLNVAGDVEMDAIIMEGQHLKAGAVAGVKNIRNPINLARMVMDKTDHVMLVGEGANLFASKMGISQVPKEELVTQENIKAWEHYQNFKLTVEDLSSNGADNNNTYGHDTVGAVAVDIHGNVACATSTGGITAKMVGRVGDSPIIGCGAYCDNAVGAVSTTGHGESIMKVTLARDVLYNMQQGMSSQAAAEKSLDYMTERLAGAGGVVVVSNHGDIGYHFTTERMAWASAKDGILNYGINPKETLTGKLLTEAS